MAGVPKKGKKGYSVEKDIERLGARHKKARAKLKPKKKKETWVDRLKRKVKKYFAGELSDAKKAEIRKEVQEEFKRKKAAPSKTPSAAPAKKKEVKTARTSAIEDQLRKSGMTEKEIGKMRSKK